MSSELMDDGFLGYVNVEYCTYYRPDQLAATARTDEMLASGEIVRVYTRPAATSNEAAIDPFEAVYCKLHGCEPHGLSACDDFKDWKAALAAPPAPTGEVPVLSLQEITKAIHAAGVLAADSSHYAVADAIIAALKGGGK